VDISKVGLRLVLGLMQSLADMLMHRRQSWYANWPLG